MTPKMTFRSLLIFSFLLAVSMPSAFGSINPCTSFSTLADYIGSGSTGCQLGDKVLSNFAFQFSGGTSSEGFPSPLVPSASEVGVSTAFAGNSSVPDWVSLTFNFNGYASVAANQTMDLKIQYVVTTPLPITYNGTIYTPSMTQVDTSGAGARRTQSPTTSSRAYLTSTACVGGPFDVAGLTPTGACLGDQTDPLLSSTSYGNTANANNPNLVANQHTISGSTSADLPATQVGVYDYIQLIGGSTDSPTSASQAAASTVTSKFYESYDQTAVPEPMTLVLVGLSLVGLGVRLRRTTS